MGDDGRLKPDEYGRQRVLSIDERKWIANELLLARLDYLYWATRYAKIKDVLTGQLTLFTPNVAQRILHAIRAEHELRRAAIELQSLKARQLGVSTDSELVVCHRSTFWASTNCVVASSDPDKSDKMSRMLERCWGAMPWWLLPERGVWVAAKGGSGRFEFPKQHCSISIQHGSQFTGISRGDTVDCYHLSECSSYPDPEELIDASLMNAVHPSEWTFGMLESTAFEMNDWWHRQWKHAKNEWPRGRSRLRPSFLPWFVGTDLWPTPTWIRDHPVPPDWEIPDYIIHHAERARAYVRSNDLLRRFLGADWRMPLSQMWYYDVSHSEAKEKNTLAKFLAEMPADDHEAFQTRNVSVFDVETVQFYRDNRRDPLENGGGVYGLLGRTDEIPQRLQPSERQFDLNRPPIRINCQWGTGGTQFTLQPLKYQGMVEEPEDGLGKLYVWHPPEQGFEFGFGVDTSDGVGRDRSVIQGIRKADLRLGFKDAQCCEYANDYVNSHDLWPFCLALGTWYSGRHADGRRMQPRLAIECKGNGETTQHELRKRGWSNFHPWIRYDSKIINKGAARKIGVLTNSWFRPMVLDLLIKWIRDAYIELNSPWLITELETLERDWDRQDTRAIYGCFDDRVMSLGFILISLYDTLIRAAHVTNPEHAMAHFYESRAIHPSQQSQYAFYSGPKLPTLSV